jgi:GT2 family glycosyltransferase
LFVAFDDYFFSRELKSLGEIVQVGTAVVSHPEKAARYTVRWGRRRVPAEDYWRNYYGLRNEILLEKQYYGLSKALARLMYVYLRMLSSALLFDDHKFYRVRIPTKGFWDRLLGRMGKRVVPGVL